MAGRDAVPAGVEDTAMSPGGRRSTCRGLLRARHVRRPYKANAARYRMARRVDETHPLMRQPGTHFGSPERTREDLSEISGHAPSRRAIPLMSGEQRGDG